MRFVKGLTQDTIKLLTTLHEKSKYYQVRQRAQCIKLNYERYKISELSQIFGVSRLRMTMGLNNWKKLALAGLYRVSEKDEV